MKRMEDSYFQYITYVAVITILRFSFFFLLIIVVQWVLIENSLICDLHSKDKRTKKEKMVDRKIALGRYVEAQAILDYWIKCHPYTDMSHPEAQELLEETIYALIDLIEIEPHIKHHKDVLHGKILKLEIPYE